MYLSIVAFAATTFSPNPIVIENNPKDLIGHWKGIEMFQDDNSYDGKTFYLPNSEEIIIDESRVRVYFYPYFKSDEFQAEATTKWLVYTIGKKKVKSDYSIKGDTLILSMNFINKNFIKMYKRTSLDESVITELDKFGFNPSSVVYEFELDTLHKELRRGFGNFSELNFTPYRYIQFMSDNSIRFNKGEAQEFERGYQRIWYNTDTVSHEFEMYKISGSQQFSILPKTLCQCDTIVLPYIVVSWADRIRKQIADDTW